MEKNSQFPNIPSNYVTLSQLQERWLKEKQQRNLKEKEKEKELQETENQQPQNLQNDVSQPNIDAPKLIDASENRRSGDRKYRGRNRKFKERFPCASSEEALVVEGNEREGAGIEKPSEDLVNIPMEQKMKGTRKGRKKKKNKKKQEQKDQMLNDGETGENEARELEEPAMPAKSEKKSIPVRRYAIKQDLRPKTAALVEKSDSPAKLEAEAKDVTEKSENTVQIEKNIADLCIDEGSGRSEVQTNTFNRRNGEYRSRDRIVNNRKYRGRIRTVNHSDSQYRGDNAKTEKQGEKEVIVLEEPPQPAKTEKKIAPVSRYEIRRDLRPENAALVEKKDSAAKLEGETKDTMEKKEDTVQIEINNEDLCIDEGSEVQNNTLNRRNGEHRSRGRIVNNRYSRYRGDIKTVNGGFNRQSAEHRGYNGGGYGGSRRYRGSYERLKEKDGARVWVKKDVAVGTDDA